MIHRRLHTLLTLDRAKRHRLLEAGALFHLARWSLRVVPFRRLAPLLGRMGGVPAPTRDAATAHEVRRAVSVAAKRHPETCFARALAGRVMLRRRGLDSSLHFGVCEDGGALKFHAWLCHGDVVVTGREGHRRYTVLTTFHDTRARAAVPA